MKNLLPSARTLMALFLSGVLAVALFFAALAEQCNDTLLNADWLNWQVRQTKAYPAGREVLAAALASDAPPMRAVISDVLDDLEPTVLERVGAGTRGLARYLRGETERWDLPLDGESLKRLAIDRVQVSIRYQAPPAVAALSDDEKAALETELLAMIQEIKIPASVNDVMSPHDRETLETARTRVRWFHGGLLSLRIAVVLLGLLLVWAGSLVWLAVVLALAGGMIVGGTIAVEPYVMDAVAGLGKQLPATMQSHLPSVAAAWLAPLRDSGITYLAFGACFLVLAGLVAAWRRFSTATRAAAAAAALPEAPPPVRRKATIMRTVRWVGLGGATVALLVIGAAIAQEIFPNEARVRQAKLRTAMNDHDWPAAFDVVYGGPGPKPANFATLEFELEKEWLDFVENDIRAGTAEERFAALRAKHDTLARHLVEPHAKRYRELGDSLVRNVQKQLGDDFEAASQLAAAGDLAGAGELLKKLRPLARFDPGFADEERAVQTIGVLGAIERAGTRVAEGAFRDADTELAAVQDYAALAADKYADARLLIRFAEVEERVEKGLGYADSGNFARAEAVLKQAAAAAARALQLPGFDGALARMYPDLSVADRVAYQPDVLVETARAYVRQRKG